MTAQRGLRQVQRCRGAAEAARFGYCHEVMQASQIHEESPTLQGDEWLSNDIDLNDI
jgi:hypothetical protein